MPKTDSQTTQNMKRLHLIRDALITAKSKNWRDNKSARLFNEAIRDVVQMIAELQDKEKAYERKIASAIAAGNEEGICAL